MFPSAQSMESADLQNSYLAYTPLPTKCGKLALHRRKISRFVGFFPQRYPRFRTTKIRI